MLLKQSSTLDKQSGKSNISIYSKFLKFQALPKFCRSACRKTRFRYMQTSRFFTGYAQLRRIKKSLDPLKIRPLRHLASF